MGKTINIFELLNINLKQKLGQLRSVPVKLNNKEAILLIYSSDFEIDPYVEMFYIPTDTLKMMLIDLDGKIMWKKDLGKGIIPGIWFCPVFAFDLNNDGIDEIYYVGNNIPDHQLSLKGRCLVKLDAQTGDKIEEYNWDTETAMDVSLSQMFRNFIMGGYVKNEPVLLTAQGTYKKMKIQCWNKEMMLRWEKTIEEFDKGARGSHVTPIVDINNDGIDELMWGERCIELNTGKELFCIDKDSYGGHSDIIQPVWNKAEKQWYIYTAREQENNVSPRVATYNNKGQRVWGAVDSGHMDINWVATLKNNENPTAMSIRIGAKRCGEDGRHREGCEVFAFDVFNGKEKRLQFNPYAGLYGRLPVDINGDGIHEFFGDGELINSDGKIIKRTGGNYAMLSKFTKWPGEQILCYYEDGRVVVLADKNAKDNTKALERYENPFYKTNMKLTGVGYNLMNLGGV